MVSLVRRTRRAIRFAVFGSRWPVRPTFAVFTTLFLAMLVVWARYVLGRTSPDDIRELHAGLTVLVAAQTTMLGFLMAIVAIVIGQTRARLDRLVAPGAELMRHVAARRVQRLIAELRADYAEQLRLHGALPDDYRRAGMSIYSDRHVVCDLALLESVTTGTPDAGAAQTMDPRADPVRLFRVAFTVLLSPAVQRDYVGTQLRDLGHFVAELMRDHDLVGAVDAAHRVRHGARLALPSLLVLVLLWLATILVVATPYSPSLQVAYAMTSLSPFVFAWIAGYYMYQVIRVYMAAY